MASTQKIDPKVLKKIKKQITTVDDTDIPVNVTSGQKLRSDIRTNLISLPNTTWSKNDLARATTNIMDQKMTTFAVDVINELNAAPVTMDIIQATRHNDTLSAPDNTLITDSSHQQMVRIAGINNARDLSNLLLNPVTHFNRSLFNYQVFTTMKKNDIEEVIKVALSLCLLHIKYFLAHQYILNIFPIEYIVAQGKWLIESIYQLESHEALHSLHKDDVGLIRRMFCHLHNTYKYINYLSTSLENQSKLMSYEESLTLLLASSDNKRVQCFPDCLVAGHIAFEIEPKKITCPFTITQIYNVNRTIMNTKYINLDLQAQIQNVELLCDLAETAKNATVGLEDKDFRNQLVQQPKLAELLQPEPDQTLAFKPNIHEQEQSLSSASSNDSSKVFPEIQRLVQKIQSGIPDQHSNTNKPSDNNNQINDSNTDKGPCNDNSDIQHQREHLTTSQITIKHPDLNQQNGLKKTSQSTQQQSKFKIPDIAYADPMQTSTPFQATAGARSVLTMQDIYDMPISEVLSDVIKAQLLSVNVQIDEASGQAQKYLEQLRNLSKLDVFQLTCYHKLSMIDAKPLSQQQKTKLMHEAFIKHMLQVSNLYDQILIEKQDEMLKQMEIQRTQNDRFRNQHDYTVSPTSFIANPDLSNVSNNATTGSNYSQLQDIMATIDVTPLSPKISLSRESSTHSSNSVIPSSQPTVNYDPNKLNITAVNLNQSTGTSTLLANPCESAQSQNELTPPNRPTQHLSVQQSIQQIGDQLEQFLLNTLQQKQQTNTFQPSNSPVTSPQMTQIPQTTTITTPTPQITQTSVPSLTCLPQNTQTTNVLTNTSQTDYPPQTSTAAQNAPQNTQLHSTTDTPTNTPHNVHSNISNAAQNTQNDKDQYQSESSKPAQDSEKPTAPPESSQNSQLQTTDQLMRAVLGIEDDKPSLSRQDTEPLSSLNSQANTQPSRTGIPVRTNRKAKRKLPKDSNAQLRRSQRLNPQERDESSTRFNKLVIEEQSESSQSSQSEDTETEDDYLYNMISESDNTHYSRPPPYNDTNSMRLKYRMNTSRPNPPNNPQPNQSANQSVNTNMDETTKQNMKQAGYRLKDLDKFKRGMIIEIWAKQIIDITRDMNPMTPEPPHEKVYSNMLAKLTREIQDAAIISPQVIDGDAQSLIKFVRDNFAYNKWAINERIHLSKLVMKSGNYSANILHIENTIARTSRNQNREHIEDDVARIVLTQIKNTDRECYRYIVKNNLINSRGDVKWTKLRKLLRNFDQIEDDETKLETNAIPLKYMQSSETTMIPLPATQTQIVPAQTAHATQNNPQLAMANDVNTQQINQQMTQTQPQQLTYTQPQLHPQTYPQIFYQFQQPQFPPQQFQNGNGQKNKAKKAKNKQQNGQLQILGQNSISQNSQQDYMMHQTSQTAPQQNTAQQNTPQMMTFNNQYLPQNNQNTPPQLLPQGNQQNTPPQLTPQNSNSQNTPQSNQQNQPQQNRLNTNTQTSQGIQASTPLSVPQNNNLNEIEFKLTPTQITKLGWDILRNQNLTTPPKHQTWKDQPCFICNSRDHRYIFCPEAVKIPRTIPVKPHPLDPSYAYCLLCSADPMNPVLGHWSSHCQLWAITKRTNQRQ